MDAVFLTSMTINVCPINIQEYMPKRIIPCSVLIYIEALRQKGKNTNVPIMAMVKHCVAEITIWQNNEHFQFFNK